jgi:glutaminyl-peptide cyclotransferase
MARSASLRIVSLAGSAALLLAACGLDRPPEVVVDAPSPSSPPALSSTSTSTTASTSDAAVDTNPSSPATPETSPPPALIGHHVPAVLAEYPHDPTAFTQGLEWHDGHLLESTGLVGESSLRLVDPPTGTPLALLATPAELFAEGVTVVDDEAVQLTYQDQVLLRTPLPLPADGPAPTERIDDAYEGEGWGLCFDGESLVMSNGSDELTFRNPETFDVERTVVVTHDDGTIDNLNELECVGEQVFANVWQTSSIIAIDAETGIVEGSVDASGLVPAEYRGDRGAVLNGIAYNPDSDTYWLTGKLWPVIYEVRFTPA